MTAGSEIIIRRISPRLEAFKKLTAALDAYQQALYPAESNHLDSIDRLIDEKAVVLGAFDDGTCVGCGAVKLAGNYAELKRMFVLPRVRGRGVARLVLAGLERAALDAGIDIVRLETGIRQREAIGLYRQAGYAERGPFGAYRDDPLSVFMEKNVRESPP